MNHRLFRQHPWDITKRLFLGTVISLCLGLAPAHADVTLTDVLDSFTHAENAMVEAAGHLQQQDQAMAAITIQHALDDLKQLENLLADPSVVATLKGKAAHILDQLPALESRAHALMDMITSLSPSSLNYRYRKSVILKLQAQSKRIQQLATSAGKYALAENNDSAGFHHAGSTATFTYAGRAGCKTEVHVFNLSDTPVVTGYRQAGNKIMVNMGQGAGTARVETVTCGKSTGRIIYNYGTKPPAGMPDMPATFVPMSHYSLSVSGNVTSSYTDADGQVQTQTDPIANVVEGSYTIPDLPGLEKMLATCFDQIAASMNQPPAPAGCTRELQYSPVVNNGFNATYTGHCQNGATQTVWTLIFTLKKAG